MSAILQMTFSNNDSSMMKLEFRLKFHWYLFLVVHLTINEHRFNNGLVYWRMMTSSNGNIFREFHGHRRIPLIEDQ